MEYFAFVCLFRFLFLTPHALDLCKGDKKTTEKVALRDGVEIKLATFVGHFFYNPLSQM